MPENLQVISHPLVQHKLSLMRKKSTSTQGFRILIREVGTLLAYEVTKDLPLIYEEIETPLMKMDALSVQASSANALEHNGSKVGFSKNS